MDNQKLPDPLDPEVVRSMHEVAARLQVFHVDLVVGYPALGETMAIPGMLVGHGLGCFVANGMTNDQIVAHVLVIVAQIRRTLEN